MKTLNLLDQSGKAYTNLDESMRPYLKSLTPEQFDEDKNWWCTALEVTGNQQSSFTIGQIVGNVISQVWDQIPALSRIKKWHNQAVDPGAACMEEANQVAKYFMMIHPRQTFQYIDNNGGKKGKSARYKMLNSLIQPTLGSNIDWNHQKNISWRFGNTDLHDCSGDYRALLDSVLNLFSHIDGCKCLNDYIVEQNKLEWENPEFFVTYDLLEHKMYPQDYKSVKALCVNNDLEPDETQFFNHGNTLRRATDRRAEVSLYLNKNITNNDIIQIIRRLFDIYGLSYDDLKMQFI